MIYDKVRKIKKCVALFLIGAVLVGSSLPVFAGDVVITLPSGTKVVICE